MKKFILTLATAAALAASFASASYAGLPGAYYQQEQSGYPQSPPGGA